MVDIQPTNTAQIIAWINGLTIPAILFFVWKASRWVTKKTEVVDTITNDLTVIKSNHLTHMQDSLEQMQRGQEVHRNEIVAAIQTSQAEVVKAIQASQTAIVQAILTLKN
jgi:uncharacterized protein (DUF2062 family)